MSILTFLSVSSNIERKYYETVVVLPVLVNIC